MCLYSSNANYLSLGSHNGPYVAIFSMSNSPFLFCLPMGLEWNQVQYHCGHLLACFTSPGWEMTMMIVKWMSRKGNQNTWRKVAPMLLCPPQIQHDLLDPGLNLSCHGTKPVTDRLSYGTALCSSLSLLLVCCLLSMCSLQKMEALYSVKYWQTCTRLHTIHTNRLYMFKKSLEQSGFSVCSLCILMRPVTWVV
jgi:hypothetical protein